MQVIKYTYGSLIFRLFYQNALQKDFLFLNIDYLMYNISNHIRKNIDILLYKNIHICISDIKKMRHKSFSYSFFSAINNYAAEIHGYLHT